MRSWVVFTFLYGIFKGFFECSKKKAVEKCSTYEVLGFFSLISFLLSIFISKDVFNISLLPLMIVLLKSILVVIAWIISLYVIKRISLSLYGVVNVSRVIFSILLGVVLLGEKLTSFMTIGIILVVFGLIIMNVISTDENNKKFPIKLIVLLLVSCFLNSFVSIIDKRIMNYMTPSQFQFWFLLFNTIIYWIIIFIRKEKINFNVVRKNYWILFAAVFLVFGDKFLFIANNIVDSKVTIMTVIKQISTIEIIILGKLMFKEKNIIKKILCSLLVILGIILTII